MAEAPVLDGRRSEAIRRTVVDLAPYYTDEWDPDAGGVGAGLVGVFAELAAEVTERLDAAPAKHRVAFFDALGFGARPPQAARVPVQFLLGSDAPRNVAVRPGTQAVAAAGEEVTFRVGVEDAFEATPARLADVIAVDPDRDAVYDHGALVDGAEAATLFTGEDRQAHEWYLGDVGLLSAGSGDTIVVDLDGDVEPAVLRHDVEWNYYGAASPDGAEGWQPLDRPELVQGADRQGDVAVALSPDGPLVEHAVEGVESKWLRARLPPDAAPTGDLTFEVREVGITTTASGRQLPDTLLANDVPQKPDPDVAEGEQPIHPFGDRPRPNDAFYIAAATAFSKPGASVTVTFTPANGDAQPDGGQVVGVNDILTGDLQQFDQATMQLDQEVVEQLRAMMHPGDPSISWEYWDGEGWSRLSLETDTTQQFTAPGPQVVEFDVPDDLEPTSVAGHDGHWIRVRLVGGDYGDVIHVPANQQETQWVSQSTGSPPAFSKIEIEYGVEHRRHPARVRTHNALGSAAVAPDEPFRPFQPLPEANQTLYFGFDGPLSGGPLQLFAAIDEHPYPDGFAPRLEWQRRRPDGEGWAGVDVQDETAGLTEQGLLGLALAEPTHATDRFGRERHWIRARVTGDAFDPFDGEESAPESTPPDQLERAELASVNVEAPERLVAGQAVTGGLAEPVDLGGLLPDGGAGTLQPCGERVETAPPGGEPAPAPPRVTGLHMNSGWARNVRAIEDERLGGSDGEREQTFAVADPPALQVDVWVDELNALSEPQQEALADRRPDDVEADRTGSGELRAFWVRWSAVPDLLDSGSDARHFVVDPTAGEVRFGDGTRGRIPPRGADNIRASYRTGGGAAGNVPAGAVAELKSGLPFVETVTNPVPGVGGADTESTAGVLERAPQTLKDRNRAVMPADYERLAADASRRVARATCIPAMDAAGDHAPGHVTVVVVPTAPAETPVPSVGLLDRVETALGEHAPASVVAGGRLVIRGPSYVTVGVEANVVAGDVGSLGTVESRLEDALEAFLHPLSGRHGEGWAFGELPTRSDLYTLLEGVEGVDHVDALFVTYVGLESVRVGEGEPQPDAAPDTLVSGGHHDLTVTPGGAG